jgi:hypothetical protein
MPFFKITTSNIVLHASTGMAPNDAILQYNELADFYNNGR